MSETVSVVAVLVVVASVVGGVPLAALADGPADDATERQVGATGTDEMAPGERMAGVLAVERASVGGELASRTFGQRVARADSNDSRAAVVGDEVADLQARLDELRAERARLRTAYDNGTISQGEYRARAARVHAEQRALQRRANHTERVAGELPAGTLRANGVNVTALRTIRTEARNLTGPEVAAVARNIAGQNPGGGLGPDRAGPPGVVGNRTDGGPRSGPGDDGGPPGNETGPPDDRGNETGSSGGYTVLHGRSAVFRTRFGTF